MTVDFSPQEIAACRQLLEVALKTVGRNAVPAYMTLDHKLEAAMAPARSNEPFEDDADE